MATISTLRSAAHQTDGTAQVGRGNAIMAGMAKPFSHAELKQLAGYSPRCRRLKTVPSRASADPGRTDVKSRWFQRLFAFPLKSSRIRYSKQPSLLTAALHMLKKIPVDDLRLGMHLHAMWGLARPSVLAGPSSSSTTRPISTSCAPAASRRSGSTRPRTAMSDASANEAWRRGAMAWRAQRAARPEVAPPAEPPARPATARRRVRRRAAARFGADEPVARGRLVAVRRGAHGRALDTEKCLPLVDEIATSVWRNPGAIVSLARLKTHTTTPTCTRWRCALMVSLGRQLGMDEASGARSRHGRHAARHGQGGDAARGAQQARKLTDAEYEIMKTHPQHGYELLQEGKGVGEVALDVTLHHHEPRRPRLPARPGGRCADARGAHGRGCDVYDAITSNRPYKAGWDPAESIAKMASWAGQFDTEIFQAFVKSLPGITRSVSLVRMRSGKLGVVVEQNESSLVAPRSSCSSRRARTCRWRSSWSTSPAPAAPTPSPRASNAQWKFPHLDELWAGPEC